MKRNIKTYGVEVTKQMQERLDWICTKLEKMTDTGSPDSSYCDIVVARNTSRESEADAYRAEIHFFYGSGETLRATTTAANPLIALDIAHDEIESTFFQIHRKSVGRRKIESLSAQRAAAKKKREDEPSWRVTKRRRFGDED